MLLYTGSPVIAQVATAHTISSPDKKTRAEFGENPRGQLVYRILYAGKQVLSWSTLGLILDGNNIGEQPVLKARISNSVNEKFAWPLGENDTIDNVYHQVRLQYASNSFKYTLTVRVFNGTVAFRYEIPQHKAEAGRSITKEHTQFIFPGAYTLYQYNQESGFTPVSIDTFSNTCDFPATLTNGKYFISLGEAVNTNYTKAELQRGEQLHSLAIAFRKDSDIKFTGDFNSPWRTISIATSAVGLQQYSQRFLQLAEPATAGLPAWIRPGKLIRAQLTTQSGIDCINFAVKHRFQYIMFDAGWYGAEFRSTSDPTQVIPTIDMQQVIGYGKEKGIGVILYVNYVGLRAKLDTIIPLFKQWGVSGIKFGFVDGLTQEGLIWLMSAIDKVNKAGFILDIHDNYKPTGLSRTYPALLTQEGIRGDENSPDAFHTTVLPFTRFLAGPADFTFCFPNPSNSYSKNIKVSKAQQLALTVIYCSPLQAIFWYGKPAEYTNEEEIEFFSEVPTFWNKSVYLSGEIGRHVSVARQSGTAWFMGNAAGPGNWNETIRLNFLQKGTNYRCTVYEDDGLGSIRKRIIPVKKGDKFMIDVKAACGQAVMITPWPQNAIHNNQK